MRILTVFILLFVIVNPAEAEEYPVASTGYVYEKCEEALTFESYEDFAYSHCGQFFGGLYYGLLQANWILLPTPSEEDPCYQEKVRAYDHVSERHCKKIDEFTSSQSKEEGVKTYYRVFETAFQFMDSQGRLESLLKMNAIDGFGYLFSNKDLCSHFEEEGFIEGLDLPISKALSHYDEERFKTEFQNSEHPNLYDQCKIDLEYANGDESTFRSTKCGMRLMGFMAGLHSTQSLQSYEPAEGQCKKVIDDFYNDINVLKSGCLDKNQSYQALARLHLENVDILTSNPESTEKDIESVRNHGLMLRVAAPMKDACSIRGDAASKSYNP